MAIPAEQERTVILDFCINCGQLLHPELSEDEEPQCDNCGNSLRNPNNRVQGHFSWSDGEALFRAVHSEDLQA